jgi:hypothetical protein
MCFPKKPIFNLIAVFAVLALFGCGVKGDPLPPEKPAEIGRGRPTYKRASEEIKMQKAQPSRKAPAKDEDEDDDDRE